MLPRLLGFSSFSLSLPSTAPIVVVLTCGLFICNTLACNNDFSALETRLQQVEKRDHKISQGTIQADQRAALTLQEAKELRIQVDRVIAEYEQATQRFEQAQQNAQSSSELFKQAEADYEKAAKNYKLVAFLISSIGKNMTVDAILCQAIKSQIDQTIKEVHLQETILLPRDLNVNQLLSNLTGQTGLPRIPPDQVWKTLGTSAQEIQKVNELPMKTVEKLTNQAMSLIGCQKSEKS